MQCDENVPKTVGGTVSVGISEDGTAEIGVGAGLPAGGLCMRDMRNGTVGRDDVVNGEFARAKCEGVVAAQHR
jgi:hypothetical protein